MPFPDLSAPVQVQTDAVLKQITDVLQAVLDSTKKVVVTTGNTLLGTKPSDDAIVPKAGDPLGGKLGIPKGMKDPIANFIAKAPAIMANLAKVPEFGGLTKEDTAAILGNLGHEFPRPDRFPGGKSDH